MSRNTAATPFDRAPLRCDLTAAGLGLGDAAFVRIFKAEHRLEVWMRGAGATRYELFRTYDICTYSGDLGPKLAEGDHQAPEGFYPVATSQLNPNSRHHLAFNLGFPNAYDRAHGRTGSFLMVHGGCSSVGCYAVTDARVDEIYAITEAALNAGQDEVPVHIFPFEMTRTALAARSQSPWHGFWQNLKTGHDIFDRTGVPPRAAVCGTDYVFGADVARSDCTPVTGWS